MLEFNDRNDAYGEMQILEIMYSGRCPVFAYDLDVAVIYVFAFLQSKYNQFYDGYQLKVHRI